MKIHIIYFNYLNKDMNGMSIGGIQSYISSLTHVFKDMGIDCCVYQTACEDFHIELNGIEIYGIKSSGNLKKDKKRLSDKCKTHLKNDDVILYGSDNMIASKVNIPTIALQHGIAWDKPLYTYSSSLFNYIYAIYKFLHSIKICINLKKVDTVVCVDNNFINWYRALLEYPEVKLIPILNFAKIAPIYQKPTDKINIIFARRFYDYRGTRIFAEAISKILNEYSNLNVTIAGDGPDKKYFEDLFCEADNVNIISYDSANSLEIHSHQHIAVIPTIGSEGTSLSLLEAMSAQCAVICTNVGGMTNIVIDDYNGLMITPDANELYVALKKLIDTEELRTRLSAKAYETVKASFSWEQWAEKWKKIINKYTEENTNE